MTLSQGVTHYDWLGPERGPIAVCVHGLTTPSYVWRGIGFGLAVIGYRVLIYDLYGRGFSDRVRGRQDADFFVRQLDELLDSQKVDQPFLLFGYSMGGAIAAAFADRNPERIAHLFLIAPAGMGALTGKIVQFIKDTPVIGDWLMLALYPYQHRKGVNAERGVPSTVPNIHDRMLEELGKRGFVPAVLSSLRGLLAAPLEDVHRDIHAAGVPTTAIWGRDDDVIPISAMGTLASWSRNTRHEVVEGAGHGIPYTHTAQVLAVVRGTLDPEV